VLSGTDSGQIAMPDGAGSLANVDSLQLPPALVVEETEPDGRSVPREEGEVRSLAVPGRAEWVGTSAAGREATFTEYAQDSLTLAVACSTERDSWQDRATVSHRGTTMIPAPVP